MDSGDFPTSEVEVRPCPEYSGTNLNGDSRVGDGFMAYTCLDCGNQWVGDGPRKGTP